MYGTIEVISYDDKKNLWVLKCSTCFREFESYVHPCETNEIVCSKCGEVHYKPI